MTDIKSLENRLSAALERIESALDKPAPTTSGSENAADLAAENAALRDQLAEFLEERRQDLSTIDQIMAQIGEITGGENA